MQKDSGSSAISGFLPSTEAFISAHFSNNVYTNVFGLARSLLGMNLLSVLLFNRWDNLFLSVDHSTANAFLKMDSIFNTCNFFVLFGFENIRIMYWLAILVLFTVVVGLYPRFVCILHFWVQISFVNASSCVEGGDQIASNLILLLIPICLLDKRTWHWSYTPPGETGYYKLVLLNVLHKVIRLQVCCIYFHSAVGKFKVDEWLQGTAIYYWLNDPFFKMPGYLEAPLSYLFSIPIMIGLLTFTPILFEIFLSFGLLCDKKYRKFMLYSGLIFHFFILLFFGLVSFFYTMAGALLLYLRDPNKPIVFRQKKPEWNT